MIFADPHVHIHSYFVRFHVHTISKSSDFQILIVIFISDSVFPTKTVVNIDIGHPIEIS